uniref:Uncharacterized protein n=1 Tax=Rhizophora mucronata TaxID=61149 RepID=A0A2P2IT49_RHIMU
MGDSSLSNSMDLIDMSVDGLIFLKLCFVSNFLSSLQSYSLEVSAYCVMSWYIG